MGWPGLYGYQGYQGQGQYGAAAGARGGYNRQGPDRSSEYFVNDEVVGGGSGRERLDRNNKFDALTRAAVQGGQGTYK